MFFITYIPRIFLVALIVGGNKIRPDRIRPEPGQFGPDFNKTILGIEFQYPDIFGHKFGHGTKNLELGFVPNFVISKIKKKKI